MDRNIKSLIVASVFLLQAVFICSDLGAASALLRVDWTSSLEGSEPASKKHLNFATPVVAGERVYVGNAAGNLYAINLARGKKVWGKKIGGPILSKVLYEGGTVYLGDGKGEVYSINAETGDVNWHAYVGEEIMATPASDAEFIFVATQNNSVVALNKTSGAIKWRMSRPQPFSSLTIMDYSDPVVIDKKVYVGNTDGVLVVYDARDGKKLFTLPLASGRGTFTDIDTSPLREGGRLYVSTMEGALYSIDYATGKENWVTPIGTPNNIVYEGENLYVAAAGKVYCLKALGGETIWEKDLGVSELSEPAISANYVVVISTSDKLYLLNKSTGDMALERHLGGGSFGSPVVAEGRLIILTNAGQVYAFRISE